MAGRVGVKNAFGILNLVVNLMGILKRHFHKTTSPPNGRKQYPFYCILNPPGKSFNWDATGLHSTAWVPAGKAGLARAGLSQSSRGMEPAENYIPTFRLGLGESRRLDLEIKYRHVGLKRWLRGYECTHVRQQR